jgi:hypothetical protein
MAKKCKPYHSVGGKVAHTYSDCTAGNNIEKDKWRSGTGGKRLCSICRDIRDGKRKRWKHDDKIL